jgi:hypothetical protein
MPTAGAAMADDPARATSTWSGGSGLTVIYGVAAPVKTPLMGQRPRFRAAAVATSGMRTFPITNMASPAMNAGIATTANTVGRP